MDRMLQISICDDDLHDLQTAEAAVHAALNAAQAPHQIWKYTSGTDLLWDIQDGRTRCDIVLLDIELPATSGLSVLGEIEKTLPDAVQILVTHHMRYVLEAFGLPAFRYIPKGQLRQRLPRALNDALRILADRELHQIVVQRANGAERIPCREIQYITRSGKNVHLHTARGLRSIRRTLSQVMEQLNPQQFVQLDRGIIVNLAIVTAVEGSQATLSTGETLPISRRRLREVREQFVAYWGQCL